MHYELFLTCPTKESGTGRRDPPYIPYIMARSHARYMFLSLYTALSALCVNDYDKYSCMYKLLVGPV